MTPRTWPVLLALGLVFLLLVLMLVADLVVADGVASRTAEIVDDEQRSIELVDDMREQAEQMARPGLFEPDLVRIARDIAADALAYEPLTAQPGERVEWTHLQALLRDLQAQVKARDFSQTAERIGRIHESVYRLVAINREAAHQQATAIRRVHVQAIGIDSGVGLGVLGLVSALVLFILRILARQRTLTGQHIQLLSERNRELDAFAGRAAHDLRVPLNPIRGYADLLMAGPESADTVREMASRIRRAVDRMSRIVDDMLELSRAGRPGPGDASPATVAAEVLEELATELDGAKVLSDLCQEKVACAPGVLAQLLRNLVGNAVKFRSRQRTLEISLRTSLLPDRIQLVVEDNGVGMNAEDAAHAFEPYYRGSDHREVPGHGLGLAIVARTMEALGGKCGLGPCSGEGTAVTLTFPRSAQAEGADVRRT